MIRLMLLVLIVVLAVPDRSLAGPLARLRAKRAAASCASVQTAPAAVGCASATAAAVPTVVQIPVPMPAK